MRPCLWLYIMTKNHFVVVYRIKKDAVYLSDPAYGLITLSKKEFIARWIGNNAMSRPKKALRYFWKPLPTLKAEMGRSRKAFASSFCFAIYLTIKIWSSSFVSDCWWAVCLQLIFPFLTQSIVDVGIQNQDIGFIYMVLFAQIMPLLWVRTSVEVLRSWILLHLSTRINISLVSDFFHQADDLPISYFDTRMTGDIMQRINDHRRIEKLLTGPHSAPCFRFLTWLFFGAVLIYYSITIFLIFPRWEWLVLLWVCFLWSVGKTGLQAFCSDEPRTEYSHWADQWYARDQNAQCGEAKALELGILYKARLFWCFATVAFAGANSRSGFHRSSMKIKNIFITFTSALLVIEGNFTLGMMLSVPIHYWPVK